MSADVERQLRETFEAARVLPPMPAHLASRIGRRRSRVRVAAVVAAATSVSVLVVGVSVAVTHIRADDPPPTHEGATFEVVAPQAADRIFRTCLGQELRIEKDSRADADVHLTSTSWRMQLAVEITGLRRWSPTGTGSYALEPTRSPVTLIIATQAGTGYHAVCGTAAMNFSGVAILGPRQPAGGIYIPTPVFTYQVNALSGGVSGGLAIGFYGGDTTNIRARYNDHDVPTTSANGAWAALIPDITPEPPVRSAPSPEARATRFPQADLFSVEGLNRQGKVIDQQRGRGIDTLRSGKCWTTAQGEALTVGSPRPPGTTDQPPCNVAVVASIESS